MQNETSRETGAESDWPMRNRARGDAEHVGSMNQGATVYYFPSEKRFARFERDEDAEELVAVEEYVREAEESLADAIERVGEETGIESMSEWAEQHLEPGDDES